MKILVISMAGVGDTLLATPLIQELRRNYPEARIDALVLWRASKDLLEGNPNLNSLYQIDLLKGSKRGALAFLGPIRRTGYDISINTHPQSRIHYRLIARVVGARIRISHLYECSGWLDRLLVNRTLPQDYGLHTVENNLAVLKLLGKQALAPRHAPELHLSSDEHKWAESFLADRRFVGRRRLGIHPGSGSTKNLSLKRWPLEQYLGLLAKVGAAWPEVAVLLFGGPEEEADVERLVAAQNRPLVVRVPSPSLRHTAALMQRCDVFLSVDTALMHLAAAVKVPRQIVIEAPTFNKTNEPYAQPHVLVRNPAIAGRNLEYYRYDGRGIQGTREELIRCMKSVSVEAVFEALQRAMAPAE